MTENNQESNQRPKTTAEVLETAAVFLDLGDQLFEKLSAELTGAPGKELGSTVQTDVRLIATWLREHPEVDQQIYNLLDAFPAK